MELILKQDVEKLGEKHDIVKVKNGFGRNYLIPRGMAVIANDTNRRILAEVSKVDEHREKKRLHDSDVIIDILKNTTISIEAKVGKEDKIFGSVTSADLAEAIQAQTKIELDKSAIEIIEEVKNIGTHDAKVKINKDFTLDMKFDVISDAPEPEVVEEKPKQKKKKKKIVEESDVAEGADSTEETPSSDDSSKGSDDADNSKAQDSSTDVDSSDAESEQAENKEEHSDES